MCTCTCTTTRNRVIVVPDISVLPYLYFVLYFSTFESTKVRTKVPSKVLSYFRTYGRPDYVVRKYVCSYVRRLRTLTSVRVRVLYKLFITYSNLSTVRKECGAQLYLYTCTCTSRVPTCTTHIIPS